MMKFNSQNSSGNLYNSLNFAPCGPPFDLIDRCAARGGFDLESPDLHVGPKLHAFFIYTPQPVIEPHTHSGIYICKSQLLKWHMFVHAQVLYSDCLRRGHFGMHVPLRNGYTPAYAQIMQHTHKHNVVTRCVEAKNVLSRRRQANYRFYRRCQSHFMTTELQNLAVFEIDWSKW